MSQGEVGASPDSGWDEQEGARREPSKEQPASAATKDLGDKASLGPDCGGL